jgi:hypothetical protein
MKTTLTTLAAAAAFAVAGLAVAQTNANPPSSTPGNGCTATANAMRGGNMSANPSGKACNDQATPTAATAAPATTAQTAPSTGMSSGSTTMGNTASTTDMSAPARTSRVARADRN